MYVLALLTFFGEALVIVIVVIVIVILVIVVTYKSKVKPGVQGLTIS